MRNEFYALMVVVLSGMFAALSGCEKPEPAAAGKPVIAVTIIPLADVTRQIVGDAADVTSLIPPGTNPHGYELTADATADLHRAKLLVMVGLNFDEWARRAVMSQGGAHAPIFEMAESLDIKSAAVPAASPAAPHKHDAHDHDDDEDDRFGPNPHLWVDPVLMRQFVEKLGPRLAELLPEHREQILKNTAALAADLQKLDTDYAAQLKPFAGRKIITFHNAFNRLAERYGITVAATLAPIEAPGGLSVESVQQAVEVMRKQEIAAVFSEPLAPDTPIAITSHGLAVHILDDLGNPADPKRDTYQHLMRYNLESLLQGLSTKHD